VERKEPAAEEDLALQQGELAAMEEKLRVQLESDVGALVPGVFWRWLCKVRSLWTDSLCEMLLDTLMHGVQTHARRDQTFPHEGPDETRELDKADQSLLERVMKAWVPEGASDDPPMLSTGALIVAHGGDITGALKPFRDEPKLDQAGLQAFTLGLKRQAGAPRTHTLLKHFIENADALQRIVLERKNGNSTPLKQALRCFFHRAVGVDNEIDSVAQLTNIWAEVLFAFDIQTDLDGAQFAPSEDDPLDGDDFVELSTLQIGKLIDAL